MANCPNCGKKLRIFDVSQYCPACGVNMRFCNFEDNFYREAKLAELSQAAVHVKVKRLKASFIGSKLTILRLVFMILPLVAVLIPNGSYSIELPYKSSTVPFSLLGLISAFSGGDFSYISGMTGSVLSGTAFKSLQTALSITAVTAVFAFFVFLLSVLCFISYKNMPKIICVFSVCGILSAVVAMVMINKFLNISSSGVILSGKSGFGLIAVIAAFGLVFAVNLLLCIKGIPVEYDEGMLQRVKIYHEVKAGKINLDDLSQPVVETAATRTIAEEIEKAEKDYYEKYEERQEELPHE